MNGTKPYQPIIPGLLKVTGHGLNSVLKNSDLSVGDFVRSTKQLIDLLNQVAIAKPELREKCQSAIKKLDRGVVVYLGGFA